MENKVNILIFYYICDQIPYLFPGNFKKLGKLQPVRKIGKLYFTGPKYLKTFKNVQKVLEKTL